MSVCNSCAVREQILIAFHTGNSMYNPSSKLYGLYRPITAQTRYFRMHFRLTARCCADLIRIFGPKRYKLANKENYTGRKISVSLSCVTVREEVKMLEARWEQDALCAIASPPSTYLGWQTPTCVHPLRDLLGFNLRVLGITRLSY
jgi:hypothetical protein